MIEVHHLTKRYGTVTAVDDVTFRVERGEILGFLGPNGAGKTTMIRTLLDHILRDHAHHVLRPAGRGVVPVVHQDDRPSAERPGMRDLLGERRARVDAAMERTRVADVRDRHCGKLSKGYRQRVGLAQAVLHNPEVLILDEPTAGLDPKQIIETRELIKGLAGDHTIILSTHILPEVSQTCQRVIIINRGQVVAMDTPANLTKRLRGAEVLYLQIDAGPTDPRPALERVAGVTRVSVADRHDSAVGYQVESARGEDIRRELARAVVGEGWGLLELRSSGMSLEQIFLQLTTSEETQADAPTAEVAHA